ncbi:MAG: heparan-alpha-glucosaminide N-acetyltransferase domain-containing protein [Bacteroidales bacterium]|nr:heparan-alpha-glucosaminide N-acetyltransferase domain-containing protein [Bacteroidales bacterium]MCF8458952.1 heparan-alpha-glucosaminide N-acetyltransferase domain-containing protein [Bacteroidales bacterium]
MKPEEILSHTTEKKQRFDYIDQFRGLIIILMLVDHASYYFNSAWLYLDPFDPLFDSWGQVALRYVSYLCAPGFLMMAGAMIWWSYQRNMAKGTPTLKIRWQLIQRGFFLVLLQITWVNSSWGGFQTFQPWHLGIIASIGISMILLSFIVHLKWQWQLFIGLAILVIHPFLLKITYNPDVVWQEALMQTFIDAGRFNKYPVLPWFALAVMGSVMATGWLREWKTDKKRIFMSLGIAAIAMIIATAIRLGRGYGNIFPFSEFGSYSFFFDQKYPPSLYFSLWFFALVVLGVAAFIAIGKYAPKVLAVFTIPGKVALFFYLMHIAIMGVFSKRLGFFYREGEVIESLIAVGLMLVVMLPLCKWFYGVKNRSSNPILRMI